MQLALVGGVLQKNTDQEHRCSKQTDLGMKLGFELEHIADFLKTLDSSPITWNQLELH